VSGPTRPPPPGALRAIFIPRWCVANPDIREDRREGRNVSLAPGSIFRLSLAYMVGRMEVESEVSAARSRLDSDGPLAIYSSPPAEPGGRVRG
jgi:hypothetical protein